MQYSTVDFITCKIFCQYLSFAEKLKEIKKIK
nr:MAG TPA: hypothetical protein [Caudoviricetes sp.]